MENLNEIRFVVSSLENSSVCISNTERLTSLCRVKECLSDCKRQGFVIKDAALLRQIFTLSDSQVNSADSDLQLVALTLLDLLFSGHNLNCTGTNVPDSYLQIAFDAKNLYPETVKEYALKCVHSCLRRLVIENCCDLEKLHASLDNVGATDKMSDLLLSVIMDVTVKSCLKFYYESLVRCMFETDNSILRSILINLSVDILPRFSIHFLSNNQLQAFVEKVKTCYIKRVGEVRNQNHTNWAGLVKFLLKCFGKVLHSSLEMMNMLLHAVELAFRSYSIDDRYWAYDCWKDLIDNYSLDMDHLLGSKQMTLLTQPLRTNISTSNPRINHKRFEVWVHLINTIQEDSLPYLNTFLFVCFNEDKKKKNENPKDDLYTKLFYQEATSVFMEIIGHYGHSDENSCIDVSKKTLLLKEPLIRAENFKEFRSLIPSGLRFCSLMAFHWMNIEDIPAVQKCMWGSFFNLLKNLEVSQQRESIQKIIIDLIIYIRKSPDDNEYLFYIIKPLLQLFTGERFFGVEIFKELILFPILKSLVQYGEELLEADWPVIGELIKCVNQDEPQDVWFADMYKTFPKIEDCNVFINSLKIWLECVEGVLYICHTGVKNDDQTLRDKILDFMMWPVAHLYNIQDEQPDLHYETVCKWNNLFQQLANHFEMEALTIIDMLVASIAPNMVGTISLLCKSFVPTNDKFDSAFLKLAFNMLNYKNLLPCELEPLIPILLPVCESSIQKHDVSQFVTACECFKLLFHNYKKYDLLVSFEKLLESAPESLKEVIPQLLIRTISDLVGGVDKKVSFKADRILRKINPSEKKFLKPNILSRSTRMIAMTKKDAVVQENPISLRLFGQTVLPPNGKIRGSQLTKAVKPENRKAVQKPGKITKSPLVIDEDDVTNYVPISSEYKFDKAKLNEHQLEVLKKDRSDIPALYQDLSQSQSNSVSALLNVKNEKINDIESHDLFESENQIVDNKPDINLTIQKERDDDEIQTSIQNTVKTTDQEETNSVTINENASITTSSTNNINKKKDPVERALKCLKLDMVGGEYFSNIDLSSKRSTRRQSDVNPKAQTPVDKTPKKSKKRKAQSVSPNQEPICTTPVLVPRKTYINTRKLLPKMVEQNEKEAEVENSEDIIESSQKVNGELNGHLHEDVSNLNAEFQEMADIQTLGHDPNIAFEETATIDPISNDNASSGNIETIQIDTKVETTPSKQINIQSSPVHNETPTRNAELIEVTESISPIALDFDHKICSAEIKEENVDTNRPNEQLVESLENLPKPDEHLLVMTEKASGSGTRAEKLLQLVSAKSPAVIRKMSKTLRGSALFSPETRKIMKRMQKCQKQLQFHRQADGVPFSSVEYEKEVMDNMLHFVRVVPPPEASPSCTILKRKAAEIDGEGLSPPRKKRVNYSDPEVTSKKFYIPDLREHFAEIVTDKEKAPNVELDGVEIKEFQDSESANTDIDAVMNEVTIVDDNMCEVVDVGPQSENLPDTETQGTLEIEDVRLLDSVKAVFPQLVNSDASVEDVVVSLSDSLFSNALLEELRRKNILTIGDLAKQSEVEINRLPIRAPKVSNLRTVLSAYHSTVVEPSVKVEPKLTKEVIKPCVTPPKRIRRVPLIPVIDDNSQSKKNFQLAVVDHEALCKKPTSEDIVTKTIREVNLIKQGAVKETVDREDLCRAVIGLVKPGRLIEIFRESGSFNIGALSKETEWPELLNRIVNEAGLPKLLSLLSSVEHVTPKTLLNACIDNSVQHCRNGTTELEDEAVRLLKTVSPSVVFQRLGMDSIINEMHTMCIRLNVSTENFFKHIFCKFTPTVEDLIPSFPHINVVQFADHTINRKKLIEKDLATFIERILVSVDNKGVCTEISRNVILPLLNESEVADTIIATAAPSSVLKICESLVQHLPKATLMEDEYKSLALYIFDKIPTADLCRYFAKHLNKYADTIHSPG